VVIKSVDIRELRKDDLQAVMEIDTRIRGFSRLDYWQKRFICAEGIGIYKICRQIIGGEGERIWRRNTTYS